jgi:hypothetical protein
MTDAVDKPATALVQKSKVAELKHKVSGDQGVEAVKDIVFGSELKQKVSVDQGVEALKDIVFGSVSDLHIQMCVNRSTQLTPLLDCWHNRQNRRVSLRHRQSPPAVPTRSPPPPLRRPGRLFPPVMARRRLTRPLPRRQRPLGGGRYREQ